MYELYQDANHGPTIDLQFESSFTMKIAAKKTELWMWTSKQLGTKVSSLLSAIMTAAISLLFH